MARYPLKERKRSWEIRGDVDIISVQGRTKVQSARHMVGRYAESLQSSQKKEKRRRGKRKRGEEERKRRKRKEGEKEKGKAVKIREDDCN